MSTYYIVVNSYKIIMHNSLKKSQSYTFNTSDANVRTRSFQPIRWKGRSLLSAF